MSTEYYLINEKNKTSYWLSKGHWDSLAEQPAFTYGDGIGKEVLKTEEGIYQAMVKDNPNWGLPYLKRLAADVFQFIDGAEPNEIILYDDLCGRPKKDYPEVGSRWDLDAKIKNEIWDELKKNANDCPICKDWDGFLRKGTKHQEGCLKLPGGEGREGLTWTGEEWIYVGPCKAKYKSNLD